MAEGSRVVALGGGHGLAATLRALRRCVEAPTAVVSVADDGGSSGRLRRELGIPAPGDIRKCLVALADDESRWAPALEYRFPDGPLSGHALGNLVLAGLSQTLGNFAGAVDEVARLVGAVGEVLPATSEAVDLKADVDGHSVQGQVAVASAEGRIRRVALVPPDPPAPERAVAAIMTARVVVLAPGSLYTSLLPVLCVPGLRDALAASPARVVQVCNLGPQLPETQGLDAADHLEAVLDHGVSVDVFLHDTGGRLGVDEARVRALGAEPVGAPVADDTGLAHDPDHLAAALARVLA